LYFKSELLEIYMKSLLVSVLRWTSKKLEVAAEAIENSTAVKNAADKAEQLVKKNWTAFKLWILTNRKDASSWLATAADRLERSGFSWKWIQDRSSALAMFAFSIVLGFLACLYLISIPFNGVVGMIWCALMAFLFALMSIAVWKDAKGMWMELAGIMFFPPVSTKKQQRKQAAVGHSFWN
jgi:hypothetical protein